MSNRKGIEHNARTQT